MKTFKQLATGALVGAVMGLTATSLYAQLPENLRDYPLATRGASGESVAPMFNGWVDNGDGTATMIFGFANLNRDSVLDIPLGPDNQLEPAELNGAQPTHFPVYAYRGLVGIQERGAFAVTVPKDTEVVWTLNSAGRTYRVPGRAVSTAYEMSNDERALGTLKPAIRFNPNCPESTTEEGIYAPRITASVGQEVTLTAYVQDRGNRADYDVAQLLFPLGTEWIMHQGPAEPDFEVAKISGQERAERSGESGASGSNGWEQVSTRVTFPEAGDYVIRLRVDNFTAPDSQFDNVCCWSNAYVPVTVTE